MAKFIPVSPGLYAIVDEADFEWLNQWKWRSSHGYAARGNSVNGKYKGFPMHREIMQASPLKEVDHINGNPLDNRRDNLRLCDSTQNKCNKSKQSNNKSGFKGAWLDKSRGTYYSSICIYGKRHWLGRFKTAEEAATAYKIAAKKHHGEFAKT